jgi:3' terminal RNA ribose 2'-O-methyltransferase Hen1
MLGPRRHQVNTFCKDSRDINVDNDCWCCSVAQNHEEADVFLSIATTRPGAKDLGFLLYKHPDRIFRSDASRNSKMSAIGVWPEATVDRAEFCLIVEVDPVERVRGLAWNGGIAQYVEPRPFLAASYMSQAISLCLRSAMNGVVSSKNPDEAARLEILAEEKWPLEIRVAPLRTSPGLINRMFEPLGWDVTVESTPLDVPGARWESDLHTVTIKGYATVQDALTQLYVLLPALDPQRHYFYDEAEVDKLMEKSRNWLAGHPARHLIVNRYLSKSRELREAATQQLDEDAPIDEVEGGVFEELVPAHEKRHQKIVDLVRDSGFRKIVDLGCGEGKLLERLLAIPGDIAIVGVEPALRDLDKAKRAVSRNPAKQMDPRVKLRHGSILYADETLKGFDVAILSEVIEHIEPERLEHAERCIFGFMQPQKVVVTTPNADFNIAFHIEPGKFRHSDHRFEWSVAEARAWCDRIASTYGYTYEFDGAGGYEEPFGHLSHFIVFEKASAA